MSTDTIVPRGYGKTLIHQDLNKEIADCQGFVANAVKRMTRGSSHTFTSPRIRRLVLFNWLKRQQDEYEEYWVRNAWGFGDKMRDYLLEGRRRIRLLPRKKG